MNFIPREYTPKNCKTEEQVKSALLYYKTIEKTISKCNSHNYEQRISALLNKLETFKPIEDINSDNKIEKDRLFYYHHAIVLSVEFLKPNPDAEKLSELYVCLTEALKISGVEWEPDKMFSACVSFGNAFSASEKKVFFINKIIESGLHKSKSIVSIINIYIKIIYMMNLSTNLSISLPNKKTLHDVSFVEFKY